MAFDLKGITKEYSARGDRVVALEPVSFHVGEGEFVSIVGPSGCGKTTLLKIIAGLVPPTGGDIEFSGGLQGEQLRTALVFQDHGLLPWYDVQRNVALGLELRGIPRALREHAARQFVDQVGLARFLHAFPHELSIGMRQRVGIARAFVSDPQILLLDEPFGSLDAQTKLVLQDELLRIWRDHRKMILHVTHDIEEAILLSDRILVMSGHPGRIREDIRVPLDRPRDLRSLDAPLIAEMRWEIWKILEQEVRSSLEAGAAVEGRR
ncbi:MAG TPA: ABC transporter ATP-binding protein [Thermoanaerobaculia bacterium]|nr:ABC transporter ATP-binding protein [Thermoanaerobaculia bacterium]